MPNSFETIISSNNKIQLDKELPNFFLPPKDLEKSMRELHFNYKQVNLLPHPHTLSNNFVISDKQFK